jgi:hypothetical protein
MLNNLEPFSHPPSKQEFAATFRVTSQISFWVQLVLERRYSNHNFGLG